MRLVYPAQVVRVVDGDTLDLLLDLGFDLTFRHHARLAMLNCPERNAPGGAEATAFTQAWVSEPGPLEFESWRWDKYGRSLGVLRRFDTSLNDALLASGHAAPITYGS